MKHILSLILLIGSFACGMDTPLMEQQKMKEKIAHDENYLQKLDQKDDSKVPSLWALCAKKINNMRLQEYLQSNQPEIPLELENIVALQIITSYPYTATFFERFIKIQRFYAMKGYHPLKIIHFDRNRPEVLTKLNQNTLLIINTNANDNVGTITFDDQTHLLASAFDANGVKLYTRDGLNNNSIQCWHISLHGKSQSSDITKLKVLKKFFNHHITIPQALLLKDFCINRELNLSNPQIKKVFDSLPKEIKEVIKYNNEFSRTTQNQNQPWLISTIGLGAAAFVGYGLWNYFKSNN